MKIEVHKEDKRGNVYTLLDELRYKDLTVPPGFESDGASVPRFFWRWVFPPGDCKALRAAFLHDYVYRTHPSGWDKDMADDMFREVLLEDGMAERYARRAYWGVRLFGQAAWKAGGKHGGE